MTSVCNVRPHHVLLENTYTNTVSYGAGGGADVNYPQSCLRFGSFDPHLEYDFNLPSIGESSIGGSTQRGANDLGFGAAYEIGYGRRWLYGANVAVTLPTGSAAFTAGKAQWTGNFNWQYFTSPRTALAGTIGFNSLVGSSGTGIARPYFALSPSIGGVAVLARGIAVGVQDAYVSADGPGLRGRNTLNVAFLRLLGPHALVYGQYGLSPAPIDGMKQGSFTLGVWVMR